MTLNCSLYQNNFTCFHSILQMKPIWGIFLISIVLIPELLMASRIGLHGPPRPIPPNKLSKRVGPFANPQRQRQRIYNHPYMEMDQIYEVLSIVAN